MNRIKVRKAQVKQIVQAAFPNYRGRTFYVEFVDSVTFCDLYWGGGSRNFYKIVRTDGQVASLPRNNPWNDPQEGKTLPLGEEFAVVQHSHFCGKDCGITVFLNPVWAPKYLEAGR